MADAAAVDSVTQRARSLLLAPRDNDLLQSYIGSRSEAPPTPRLTLQLPPEGRRTSDSSTARRTSERRRSSQASALHKEQASPKKNTPFAQMTKDIKLRRIQQQQQELQMLLRQGRRSGKGGDSYYRRGEECYTDKDRAAAVNMGTRDIKLSLKLKRRQERNTAMQISDHTEPGTLLALGRHEMRGGDLKVAQAFVNKALELQPNDKHALVARSKCHLLLGLAQEALEDADSALAHDRHFIKAIFQKAEALYHLGDFEHSLVYYHRGQRLRPEQAGFRLGVQKAQEAIENSIGSSSDKLAQLFAELNPGSKSKDSKDEGSTEKPPSATGSAKKENGKISPASSNSSGSKKPHRKRHFLGQLSVDRQYLENLLQHPDIKTADDAGSVEQISAQANEGVAFLKRRQHFWRQQCPGASETPSSKSK